jgi:hypothetical protein
LKDKKQSQKNDELVKELKDLDVLMGLLLTEPSTKNALSFARKVKAVSISLNEIKSLKPHLIKQLYSDAISLHHAILVFNTDPNLVAQNAMARVLSGLTPAILSLEEYLSGEDVNFWEILMDGSAIFSHHVSTTPYVTASKYLVDFRFQDELVKVEERLVPLFTTTGQSGKEAISKAATICDEIREKDLGYSEKPGYIFLFWYSILIISYKNFKDNLDNL